MHVVSLLLFIWAVFAYRDFWPLATYSLQPADISDKLLWPKFIVLTMTAVGVPLLIPRPYVPFDPKVSVYRSFLKLSNMSQPRNQLKSRIQSRRHRFFRSFCSLSWTRLFSRLIAFRISQQANSPLWPTTTEPKASGNEASNISTALLVQEESTFSLHS